MNEEKGVEQERKKLLLWLSLFRADTAEELERIKALAVPEMNEAIIACQKIIASPELRRLDRALSDARRNEASALGHARREGEAKEREKWQAEIERLRAELSQK